MALSEISPDLTEMTFFRQMRQMGQIMPKTSLHLKMSHIQQVQAFLVYCSNFAEIVK